MKRALYIAGITGLFLLIFQLLGVPEVYIAFVAFPIFFADPDSSIDSIMLHVLSITIGFMFGIMILLGNFYSSWAGIILSMIITFTATALHKELKSPMIFGSIGMILGNPDKPLTTVLVLFAGLILAAVAKNTKL